MAVRFILGRAGTGKTTHCLQQMTELHNADPLGPPIYWLLPKQATFQAERRLTCMLGAFSRIRIVSIDLLGKEILTACGDVGIPEVTAIGRRMLIGLLLRKHQKQLKFYSLSAHRAGLAAELDSTFGEFGRAGLDSSALDDLLHRMEPDDSASPALRDKLSDVQFLLSEYTRYIGQDRLDPQRRLSLILQRVGTCADLRQATIFVDDFYDFTAYERKLITALATVVARAEIALLADPDSAAIKSSTTLLEDLSIFHRTERTYRSLVGSLGEAGVQIDPPILLHDIHRYQSPSLAAVERSLFNGDPVAAASATNVEWSDAPDPRAEVDAVARRIRKCLADGLRYRDITVLVRGLGDYLAMIDASFAEHGLPYFADHRRTASHHPLLQLVRSSLQIAHHQWPRDATMTLIKCGLAGINDADAGALENFVLRHRIRSWKWESPEPWSFRRELTINGETANPALTESARIDELRKQLVGKLTPLLEVSQPKKPHSVREFATAVFAMLEAFGVRSQLAGWMIAAEIKSDFEQRGEHEQVWAEFTQLFEHMVDLIGDELISLADFISVLDSGLESFDLALTPPTVDQIVVGQIDRTRTNDVKIAFVLGLSEGTFPQMSSEKCVLTDSERRTLRRRNIDLDPDSERRLLDERFLAYLAFTRASHSLVLSRPLANEKGRATGESSFWIETISLFSQTQIQHVSRPSRSDPGSIGTPRQLITALMRWVRAGDFTDPNWSALYQWLANRNQEDRTAAMRERAWPALSYTNNATLDPSLAAQVFTSPLRASVSQLETAAACPFRHFAKYSLKLYGRDNAEVTHIDLSNAYHSVLENLVADCLSNGQDWCRIPVEETRELIRTHAAEIGRRLRGELMLSTSRNKYMLDRIERTLEQAVASMMEMNNRGKYRPGLANVRFGADSKLPAHRIPTPVGNEVHLHGSIDRVDLHSEKSAFTVSDYKFAAGALRLDRVYHGLSLQLLTYLLVVQANGQQIAGRALLPAAAFLLQLLRSPEAVAHPSLGKDPGHPDFPLRIKPRGLIDMRAIKSLDGQLEEGQSAVVQVYVKKGGVAGRRNATDDATAEEFSALLKHVENRLGEITDDILRGNVSVKPYMIGNSTPCPHCEYRSVCRFEPGINHYRMLPAIKREDVLAMVVGKTAAT